MSSYRVTVTKQDFAAGYALNWRRILRKPIWPVSWLLLGLGAHFLFDSDPWQMFRSPRQILFEVVIALAAWLSLYLLVPLLSGWIAGRWQYHRYPMIQRETDLKVEAGGLVFLSGADQWRNDWANYIGQTEDRNVMLLYVSPQMFQILPVRALPGDVRAGIAARIPRR